MNDGISKKKKKYYKCFSCIQKPRENYKHDEEIN